MITPIVTPTSLPPVSLSAKLTSISSNLFLSGMAIHNDESYSYLSNFPFIDGYDIHRC
ncbi:MAG TPA: hypothetical protein VK882_06675 [Nitrososphaeraceae archaeon]|nr:hypothetical protein [Nitrososphaeraceae archaeon]